MHIFIFDYERSFYNNQLFTLLYLINATNMRFKYPLRTVWERGKLIIHSHVLSRAHIHESNTLSSWLLVLDRYNVTYIRTF